MWNESTSLYEMQQDINHIFEEKMRLHKKVCDIIDLPFEDYELIINKLKLIQSADEIDHYSLSILVAWVGSYNFSKYKDFDQMIKNVLTKMPQHHTKYILEAINTTCYDYQIDLFNHYITNLNEIREIIKIHAGY